MQVGQAQGGLMGVMQRAMSRAESHIWFMRSEVKDRMAVAERSVHHHGYAPYRGYVGTER